CAKKWHPRSLHANVQLMHASRDTSFPAGPATSGNSDILLQYGDDQGEGIQNESAQKAFWTAAGEEGCCVGDAFTAPIRNFPTAQELDIANLRAARVAGHGLARHACSPGDSGGLAQP